MPPPAVAGRTPRAGLRSVRPGLSSPLLVQRELLSSQLAFRVRLSIVQGDLPPGARLTEKALAEQAHVSRSTVREALRILTRSGLVRLVPMSGARVMTLEARDAREICEVRIALETSAAWIVAASPAPNLDKAEDSLKRLAAAVRGRRWVELIDADLQFHRSIVAAAGNNRLMQFWNDLENQVRLYLSYRAEEAYDLDHLLEAHETLLAAVRTHDPAHAAEAFRAGLSKRADRRLTFWTQVPQRDRRPVPPSRPQSGTGGQSAAPARSQRARTR